MTDIAAVNRFEQIALTDNDDVLPITDWVGVDGEFCDAEAAVVAVAGPLKTKNEIIWFSVDLREFQPVKVS